MSTNSERIGILLISDMHLTDTVYGRGASISKFDKSYGFYNKFEMAISDSIKKQMKLKYIVIAGDVADFALDSEYRKALDILNKLCNRFEIEKKNVLIVPGNHDISREEYRMFCYNKQIPLEKFSNYQAEKFRAFKSFYDEFYGDTSIVFDPDKAVNRTLLIKECDVLFVGINTLFKESFRLDHHFGYINAKALDAELEQIRKVHNDIKIITVMHHSPETSSASLINPIKNWDEVSPLFRKYSITTFIGGHAHTSDGVTPLTKITQDFLTCGSLSASEENVNSSFILLKHAKEEDHYKFHILPFNFEEDYNNGYWQLQTNKDNMIEDIIIK